MENLNSQSPPISTTSELISHWRIQEGLFQNYRRLFLTLETFLLSLGPWL